MQKAVYMIALGCCAAPVAAQCPPTLAEARTFVAGFKRTSVVAPGPDGESSETYAGSAKILGGDASDLMVTLLNKQIVTIDIQIAGKPADYAAAFGAAYPLTGALAKAQCGAGRTSCAWTAPRGTAAAGALVKATLGTDQYEPGAHLVCSYDRRRVTSALMPSTALG